MSGGRCDFAAPAGVTGSGGSACAAVDAGMLGGPSLGGVASGGGPALGAVGPKSADGMLVETRALGRGRSGRRRGQTTASPQPRAASDHIDGVVVDDVVDTKAPLDVVAYLRTTFSEMNRALGLHDTPSEIRTAIRVMKKSLLQVREGYDGGVVTLHSFAAATHSFKMRLRRWLSGGDL